jgi:hypothetical protein
MTVYIYRNWFSTDIELIDEQAFEFLAQQCDDISYAENNIDYEMENNVDEEEMTQHDIDVMIKNGYILLGER